MTIENGIGTRVPVHPGEMLLDDIQELGLSASQFAREICVPTNRVTEIIKGERSITADTALRLSVFFGTSAKLWLNLQSVYDLQVAEQKSYETIKKTVRPYVMSLSST